MYRHTDKRADIKKREVKGLITKWKSWKKQLLPEEPVLSVKTIDAKFTIEAFLHNVFTTMGVKLSQCRYHNGGHVTTV